MKILAFYSLQFPMWFVCVFGLHTLTDLSIGCCVPLCALMVMCYDIGEMVRRGE
jgi:hypothetical protein